MNRMVDSDSMCTNVPVLMMTMYTQYGGWCGVFARVESTHTLGIGKST